MAREIELEEPVKGALRGLVIIRTIADFHIAHHKTHDVESVRIGVGQILVEAERMLILMGEPPKDAS